MLIASEGAPWGVKAHGFLAYIVIVTKRGQASSPAEGMLGFRITHCLSERDKLRLIELHRSGEPLIIDRPAEYGCQPFRGAKQIDVLTDEASID